MERYNIKDKATIENQNIDKFVEEIIHVYKKHGLSISHEDGYGSFIIEKYSNENVNWFVDSSINI